VFIADQTLANYDSIAIRMTLRMDLAVTHRPIVNGCKELSLNATRRG
jgi:hypothetical protein